MQAKIASMTEMVSAAVFPTSLAVIVTRDLRSSPGRIRKNSHDAQVYAFIRGDPALKAPLRFVRVDPYVVPKTSLTGDSPERTDTRVLQVIYSYDPATLLIDAGNKWTARRSPKRGRQTLNGARGYKN